MYESNMSNLNTELPTNQTDSTREEANTNKNNAKKTNFKRNDFQSSELKSFTGETPELDSVLSLLSEKVDKGVTFDFFSRTSQESRHKEFQQSGRHDVVNHQTHRSHD